MKIPFSKVDCSGNESEYINQVLKSGWLTTSSKAEEFELFFRTLIGVKHAIALNSCTSALHLALEAIGVGPGDKVLVPSMTFTSSAEVIRYLGADPIFLDIDYGTTLITSKIVKNAISSNINLKALISVDFAGHPAPLISSNAEEGILELCHSHGIKVISDSAHAFPSKINGSYVGNIADITCFSFYANKTITTAEGGMLTTNDAEIAARVKLMRLHGIDRDIWKRYTSGLPQWEYDVLAPGYKYNMPDLNAAIGLAQLERVEEMRSRRQKIAEYYLENLSNIKHLDLPEVKIPNSSHAWHLFTLVLNEYSNITRDEIIKLLFKDGIGISVHYKPLHRMSYYKKQYNLSLIDYPNTERIWKGTFSLPIYSLLEDNEVEYIVERVKFHLTCN
jgi:dTDP-4-amino-4,6-dideoxygalactose transaminase